MIALLTRNEFVCPHSFTFLLHLLFTIPTLSLCCFSVLVFLVYICYSLMKAGSFERRLRFTVYKSWGYYTKWFSVNIECYRCLLILFCILFCILEFLYSIFLKINMELLWLAYKWKAHLASLLTPTPQLRFLSWNYNHCGLWVLLSHL